MDTDKEMATVTVNAAQLSDQILSGNIKKPEAETKQQKESNSDAKEAAKNLCGYTLSVGGVLISAPIGVLFLFKPEEHVSERYSSQLFVVHAVSLAANYMALLWGLYLLGTYDPVLSPTEMRKKRRIINTGLFSLALGMFSRLFLALPTAFTLPLAVAVVLCAAVSMVYIFCPRGDDIQQSLPLHESVPKDKTAEPALPSWEKVRSRCKNTIRFPSFRKCNGMRSTDNGILPR